MSALKILIVEDNTLMATDLRETLEEAGHRITEVARTFESALKAVKSNPPDLALIDIYLENSTANGIDTARELLIHHRMPIIYLTSSTEKATFESAKKTLPAAYLLKPFRADELKLQVELAYHYFQSTVKNGAGPLVSGKLFLPIGKGHEKIDLSQVLYLKADGAYVKVFLFDKELPHHISTNLGHLEQYFSMPNFYRLSRSLLINLDHIERLEQTNLFMDGHKAAIEIPAASRKELMKKLTVVRTK